MSALPVPDKRLCSVCGRSCLTEHAWIVLSACVCPLCVAMGYIQMLAYKPERREIGR